MAKRPPATKPHELRPRFTVAEYNRLRKAAKANGETPTGMLRRLALESLNK